MSGASGIVGYGILKSLRLGLQSQHLIGVTAKSTSAAPGFCDATFLAPLTSDSNYLNWLLDLIEREKIDVVVPGIDADMYKWSSHEDAIRSTSAVPVLNSSDLIALCGDKYRMYLHLSEENEPCVIESSISSNFDDLLERFGLPMIAKPRRGFGSKGILRISTKAEFEAISGRIGAELLVQPLIGTDTEEYTVAAFGDGDGGHVGMIAMRRSLSSDGYTEFAEVVDESEFNESVGRLTQSFKTRGPTNFQFRRSQGELKLLEINPRISSSTSIRSHFGYNESQMAIDHALSGKRPEPPNVSLGRAVRYVEDMFFDNATSSVT